MDFLEALGSWLFYTPLGLSFVLVLLFMTIVWAVSYRMNRFDLVDSAWGIGFVIVALTAFLWQLTPAPLDTPEPFIGFTPRVFACAFVVVWGVRLSFHIMRRWLRRPTEDVRYKELRKTWKGNLAVQSYVKVFLLQAILIYIICLPVIIISVVDPPADGSLVIGGLIWLIGFLFESIGDYQLAQFSKNKQNKGKLLMTGLWKFTRHPNYFGEVIQWWGITIIAASLVLFSPFYAALILPGPVILTVLILKVSGVPLTEKLMSKREGWENYSETTSKFLPLPPKKG